MFDSTTHNKLKFANSYIKPLFDNWMSIIDSQALSSSRTVHQLKITKPNPIHAIWASASSYSFGSVQNSPLSRSIKYIVLP